MSRRAASLLLAGALLLAPAVAWADPITIVATLAPYIGGTLAAVAASAAVFVGTYGGYILAAYSVYGGIQARRKAKRAAAAARRAYNDSLTDRTITTLQATPPLRVVYGRAIVGGDIVAILTSDKVGLRDNGSTYTKPDALKHLVIVVAGHECQDIHELYVDGIPVGALDGSGWATGGEFGGLTRTVYQERVLAPGASATFDAAPTVVSAGYMGEFDTGWVDTTYSVSGNQVTNTSGQTATISVRYSISQGTVRWEKHLGTADQAASAYLQSVVPSEWDANARLRGLTYLVVTLDLEEPRFQGGPPPLTFDVSGRVFYDARKNEITTADLQGGAAGEPGTVPSGMGASSGAAVGLSRQLAFGVEGGIPYVDVRYFGTVTAAGSVFLTWTVLGASEGQVRRGGGYAKLVAGSMAGTGGVLFCNIQARNGSTVLVSGGASFAPESGVALSSTRQISSQTLTAPAGTDRWLMNFGGFSVSTVGAVVDVTVRVARPMVFDPDADPVAAHDNPALVIRDWLTAEWGFGVAAADLDQASVTAAANACDESISLTVGGDTTSGARYTCNGAVTTEAAPEVVLEELAQSMAGLVTHTGGLWVVNAGTYTAPVLGLTEDLQAGAIEVVQAGTAYADLFNGMRGRMIERGRAVESDFDPYSNSAFVAEDGAELWADLTLPWTDNRARARNLARIFTEQARDSLVIRYPAQLHAWPLQVGDRVTVTSSEYGWAAKVFRVTDWQWGVQSAVLLTLQEDGPAIYDLADAATADQLPNTGLPNPYTVPAITGAAAASGSAHLLQQGDGSIAPRVRVSWDAVASAYVTQGGRIELRWRRLGVDAADQWRSVDAPGDSTGEYLLGAGVGDKVVIGLRAVNSLGARSDEVLIDHTVDGDTTAPANATGLAYANVVGGMRVSWTKPGEGDYLSTEVRQGASWAAGALLWIGNASNFTWTPPLAGAYTLWVVHRDRSGNESAPQSLATTYTVVGATSGGNSATVRLYKREDLGVAPAIPSVGLTYDFVAGAITAGDTAGWSITPTASSGGRYEWVIQAVAFSVSTTDGIAPGEWTAPQIHVKDGTDGSGALIEDGGFEVAAGGTPWTLDAAATLVGTAPLQGAQHLRVADTVGGAQRILAGNIEFACVGGAKYRCGVHARLAVGGPTVNEYWFGIMWRDAGGFALPASSVFPMLVGSTDYQAFSAEFTAPLQAVTGQAVVYGASTSGLAIFVDNFALEAGGTGAAGLTARSLRLGATTQIINVSDAGVVSPVSVTLTAQGSNLTGSPAFSVIAGTVTLLGTSGTTRSFNVSSMLTDQVTVRVSWGGFTDDLTISKVYAGRNAITPVMDNAAHTIPADEAGAVLSYAGSGTTLQVFEGSAPLQFGSTLAPGRFIVGTPVVSPAAAITVGARTGVGTNTCTVPDHSGATTGGPAVIQVFYPLTVRRADGSDVLITVTQTLTIVRRGAPGADGDDGAPGQRGSVQASRQIAGSVWSDAEANTAISAAGYGSPQTLDLVTLYNAAGTFSETRVRSGASWITYAARVDGNLLVLGTITTDKLVANAVTAAQGNGTAATLDTFASSAAWLTAVRDILTLTTTGAPVKALAVVTVDFVSFSAAAVGVKVTAQILVGGVLVRQEVTTVATVGATARGGSAQRQALVKVPVIWRHTPAAGARTYQYRVLAEPMDSTGAALAAPGELWTSAALVAEENKV